MPTEQKSTVRKDSIVKIIPGERFTPFGLAKKLNVRAILESSSFQKGRERYSLLMVREAFRLEQRDEQISLHADGKAFRIGSKANDILDVLLYFANQHAPLHQDFPFPAGGIGFLSYEFARYCDAVRFTEHSDALGLPDAAFLFGHIFLVFDHYTDLLYLIGLNYREHEIDLAREVARTEEQINDLNFNYLQPDENSYPSGGVEDLGSRDWYTEGVEKIRDHIVQGDILQAVLSRRLIIDSDLPAIEAYRRLRTANPSPYLFLLDFGDYQLFGSSPEMQVKVKEGKAIMRPIAGTRPRGRTAAEDHELERELLEDEKECAEHLMLVDLCRNDLGRVCEPGTVKPTEYMVVERFSHVMHIVTQVEGQLDQGKTGIDAVRATFPAGTVSGAPKIRAMQILDEMEEVKRSFYAGLVGYVEPGGSLDTCITIRSGVKIGNRIVLQAGAGIVFDSVPEREYRETENKLGALVAAAELTEGMNDTSDR